MPEETMTVEMDGSKVEIRDTGSGFEAVEVADDDPSDAIIEIEEAAKVAGFTTYAAGETALDHADHEYVLLVGHEMDSAESSENVVSGDLSALEAAQDGVRYVVTFESTAAAERKDGLLGETLDDFRDERVGSADGPLTMFCFGAADD